MKLPKFGASMDTMDEYDEVHVVSDLHLGGDAGHQIFAGQDLLRDLIRELAVRAQKRRVLFVINGDFVDFLAEPGADCFDPAGAPRKLRRIANDPNFSEVWSALSTFVESPLAHLAIVLGNHDLELALPSLQKTLIEIICRGSVANRGRLSLSLSGEGVVVRVAQARVVCLHGNEVDTWNVTDFERLRRISRDHHFGRGVPAWVPSAGTKLVVSIMNRVKRDRPFIDLLKPETDAVLPVVFALCKNDDILIDDMLEVVETAARLTSAAVRRSTGFLTTDDRASLDEDTRQRPEKGETSWNAAAAQFVDIMSHAFQMPAEAGSDESVHRLLDETEVRFRRGLDPLALDVEDHRNTLGAWNLTKSAVRAGLARLVGTSDVETLRRALQHLKHDRSFNPQHEDQTYRDVLKFVPTGVDYVVVGHTHLRRSLSLPGGGRYLNTGTWAYLIEIDKHVLDDPAEFKACYDALNKKTLAELRATRFVRHLPTVASIVAKDGQVDGVLNGVFRGASGIRLEPVSLEPPGA